MVEPGPSGIGAGVPPREQRKRALALRGRGRGRPAPAEESRPRPGRGRAIGFWLVLPLALAVAVLATVAVGSLGRYLYERTLAQRVYRLVPPATPADSYTRLHVEIARLDELDRQVTLRIAGNHICDGCGFQTRVVFTALRRGATEREGLPPEAAITFPAGSEAVSADLRLPMTGDLIAYPFDRYSMRLGLSLERLVPTDEPGGTSPPVVLTPAQATGRLFVTLEEQVPQVDLVLLAPVAEGAGGAAPAQAGRPAYLSVTDVALERPAYLKVQLLLVVALVAAGAVYVAWLQPVGDVLARVGTLVLGVWGIRSLLLGSLPPYATAVDAVLTLVILTVLSALVVRALYRVHDRAGLRLLPRARRPREVAPAPPAGPAPERRAAAGLRPRRSRGPGGRTGAGRRPGRRCRARRRGGTRRQSSTC
jgi:hypothetical protein